MRKEDNAMGGKTIVLEHPDELGALGRPLLALVPAPARALFEGFPGSLLEISKRASSKRVGRALATLAQSQRCELEISRGGEPEVYVRVGELPVLLSGALARVPARCPSALTEVLKLVGVARVQYGCALGLLFPAEQRRLSALAAEYEQIYPGELANLPMPEDPKAFFAIYESSGAYLCSNRAGDTWKFSLTGGDYGAGPPVAKWLDAFFEAGPFGPGWAVGN